MFQGANDVGEEAEVRVGRDVVASSLLLQESIWAAKNSSTSARVLRGKRSDGDAIAPGFEIGRRVTGLRFGFCRGAKNESKKSRRTRTEQQTTRRADERRQDDAPISRGYFFNLIMCKYISTLLSHLLYAFIK